ncbi:MAG: choice-of-anchor tandem repeat GloVer-containing protein [Candidatus Korobacteraceae bacterium]
MTQSTLIGSTAASLRLAAIFMAAVFLFVALAVLAVPAQTFQVIHSFTGGAAGSNPANGLTLDRAGNIYGGTQSGGINNQNCDLSCGLIFKLARGGSGWIYSPLYLFPGGLGGAFAGRLTFGPNGSLYGLGGDAVYNLQPQANRCSSFSCPWNNTILWSFCCGILLPGGLTFDASGNIYGGSYYGGFLSRDVCQDSGCGYIFQLVPTAEGWSENIIYEFHGGDGAYPNGQLVLDQSGNVYGTTINGGVEGDGDGNVFELTPSGDGYWNETILYRFTGGADGKYPYAGVIFDSSGNLYGATARSGADNGGTIFELTPSSGGWNFNLLYTFTQNNGGVGYSLIMDSEGNLYGTTTVDGAYNFGNVFKLTRSDGGWTYTSLHDFTGGSDGAYPIGSLAIDSSANLYGATAAGGNTDSSCDPNYGHQCGVLFEITQ